MARGGVARGGVARGGVARGMARGGVGKGNMARGGGALTVIDGLLLDCVTAGSAHQPGGKLPSVAS